MTFAVIPAAGKSTRMGRPKLSLPLGDRTVLEHVITALRQAGIEHILVVIGPQVPELAALAESAGAHACLLPQETPDMRATVEAGLRWLEERFHPRAEDNWLLVPADHPTLDPAVVRQLLEIRAAKPSHTIVIPTYRGTRGHPTVIAWKHVEEIRQLPSGLGLNAYLRQQGAETLEVSVDSADVLYDLDKPEDYERIRRRQR